MDLMEYASEVKGNLFLRDEKETHFYDRAIVYNVLIITRFCDYILVISSRNSNRDNSSYFIDINIP